VFDVGCSTGWFTRRLTADSLCVMGADRETRWLAFTHTTDVRSIYLPGDARALPFGDRSFDHVLSAAALCLISDWPAALREIVTSYPSAFCGEAVTAQQIAEL
jgi:ubiquinone/menaquinone biosynthesis C-methylase UbiE